MTPQEKLKEIRKQYREHKLNEGQIDWLITRVKELESSLKLISCYGCCCCDCADEASKVLKGSKPDER